MMTTVHLAIMYYRQAVQLVPDIEFKVSPKDEPKLGRADDIEMVYM